MDSETKQATPYLVEGYINGQNWKEEDVEAGLCTAEQVGQKKWLTNDDIKAIHDASGNAGNPWIIGAGNQPFWGNIVIDAKAGKTYWLFQGNSQIGFQQYTFYPGKSKEEVIDGGSTSIKGDVNGDGQVGIGDIICVTNFMAGTPGEITLEQADVNGDGEVGIGDIITITNIMAGVE